MILAQGCPGHTSDVDDANWDNVIVDLAAEYRGKTFIFLCGFCL
jgi:hypothetical protein